MSLLCPPLSVDNASLIKLIRYLFLTGTTSHMNNLNRLIKLMDVAFLKRSSCCRKQLTRILPPYLAIRRCWRLEKLFANQYISLYIFTSRKETTRLLNLLFDVKKMVAKTVSLYWPIILESAYLIIRLIISSFTADWGFHFFSGPLPKFSQLLLLCFQFVRLFVVAVLANFRSRASVRWNLIVCSCSGLFISYLITGIWP